MLKNSIKQVANNDSVELFFVLIEVIVEEDVADEENVGAENLPEVSDVD